MSFPATPKHLTHPSAQEREEEVTKQNPVAPDASNIFPCVLATPLTFYPNPHLRD